ncbi:MAG: type II toxin-antitoxin system HicA family toxin [Deltaproteobacteria bacterium]|nr:type II toxin-antitoxin system HicA family toxin [Deltaproteobacteria bacterium]MBW2021053.1 type II toxin-antitoxin system HicA family toxin [Deltaproteobacteria bacterium]
MSPKLPKVSGQKAIKALQKIGYEIVRQKGSHIRLRNYRRPECRPITVPKHTVLKPGLLRSILHDANLSIEQFSDLL